MTQQPPIVAWLHEHHPDAYVITDRVKNIWLRVEPRHVEHYTIPVYTMLHLAKSAGLV